jgi:protein TonB
VAPIITDDTTGDDNALNQDILAQLPVSPGPGDIGQGSDSLDVPDVIDLPAAPEPILLIVDEMPEFVGGDEARMRYLRDNLNYPRIAKEAGITGTVYVNFVIDAQGKVTNVTLIRGIGGGCDEEALRVVSGMPAWKPGKNGGRAVRVGFSMPIRFILEG